MRLTNPRTLRANGVHLKSINMLVNLGRQDMPLRSIVVVQLVPYEQVSIRWVSYEPLVVHLSCKTAHSRAINIVAHLMMQVCLLLVAWRLPC